MRSERLLRWLPLAAIATTFVAMLAATWGAWPDVLVDFGHELYAAWQLSQGKVLGRDVSLAATGPLSPYVNALLFRLAGPGLHVLVTLNVALLALLTWAIYALLAEAADRATATAATLFFLTVLAVGQYVGTGNFNYVTPYSHGVTHGLVLSAAALLLAGRYARGRALRDAALASACLGLVFLTKPEIFGACAAALAVALVLVARDEPRRVRLLAACALPALAVVASAFGLLALHAGAAIAFRATFAPWLFAATPLARSRFYVTSVGLDAPGPNTLRALWWLGAWLAVLVPAALVDWRLRSRAARWVGAVVGAAVTASLAATLFPATTWLEIARPLPVAAVVAALAAPALAWRARPLDAAGVLRAAGSTFAVVLLAKIALNARLHQYGFALAMPATMLTIAWLLRGAPALLRRAGGSGVVFRASVCAALVVLAGAFVRRSALVLGDKVTVVGEGGDAFSSDLRGAYVNAMLAVLRREPPGTLAVIPEGVMVNYLSRRENPSPYLSYLPDALAAWGEPALLGELRRSPPTYIAIVHRDAREHGAATFGVDYAVETLRWIREGYEPIARFGSQPLQLEGYGVVVLRRQP